MRYVIILITLILVFLAFFGNFNLAINNSFIAYIFYLLNYFVKFFPIILVIFCAVSGFIIWRHYTKKHTKKKTFNTVLQIFEVLIIAIFSAFVILLLIGLIQLNSFSYLLNKNPASLGVKTDVNQIYSAIKNNNRPPTIITSDRNSQDKVIAVAKATSGTDNFYGKIILSGVPHFLIIPVKNNNSNFLFLDNTLIVTQLDEKDLQKLSPLVGYLLVKQYFQDRIIRSYPTTSVMSEKEYQDFRKKDAAQKLKKINVEVEKMESYISSISATIEDDKIQISKNASDQDDILTQQNKEYDACLSEGTYKANIFIPKNTKEYCQKFNDTSEKTFIESETKGKLLTKKLADDQKKLAQYKYYDTYFKAQQKLMSVANENIPAELGIFQPKDSIKIVILNSDSTAVGDYFETLAHEYLHYASYTDGKRLESSFFEEGLTEYFARQIIRDNLKINTNIGYPINVKIIEAISSRISDSDLTEIYFNKDQSLLEKKMDLVYGDGFYKNNIVLFESLQYTSDLNQALEIANQIMDKIGGNHLSENDFFSTNSDTNQ